MPSSKLGRRTRILALASAAPLGLASHQQLGHAEWTVSRRALGTNPSVLSGQSFDYVIVGGGTAGLVVANRLSANGSTVAVIEAGGDGADVMDRILAPAATYYNGIEYPGSPYDWGYSTTNQTGLNNRQIFWPRAKLVGGSSGANGAYLIRHGQIEQDAWAALNPGSSRDWSWEALWPFMAKSEYFTAPLSENVQTMNITYNDSAHGHNGPIHFSYPGYAFPSIGAWSPAWESLGVPSRDGVDSSGKNYDAFVATSCINPSNWTRSYAKTGYLDPIDYRTNLQVLGGYQAMKINFGGKDSNGNATATSVSFAESAAGTVYTVNVTKEVIISAGVIGTPQLLQLSGIGASSLLQSLNIDVIVDLPGVGEHLQDHVSAAMTFNTTQAITGDMLRGNETFNATQWALWKEGSADSLLTAPNDAVAYINASFLMGENFTSWHNSVTSNMSSWVSAYSSNADVQAGYQAVYESEANTILTGPTGAVEFLLTNTGTRGLYPTQSIQAAIQHPLTQGYVRITSTSAFDKPEINPNYFQHPADVQLMVKAFQYVRTIAATAPLSTYLTTEISPGSSVSTDIEWESYLSRSLSTEYHPAGTSSMLPREKGGVVNTALQVYGTSNVRVIDASVVAVGLSAHLMAPTYGIGEKGADIILNGLSSKSSNSSSLSGPSSGPSSTSSSGGSGAKSAASHSSGSSCALIFTAGVALAGMASSI